MNLKHNVTLPGGLTVTLSWDGQGIAWQWEGPDPGTLSPELRRQIEAAYMVARAQFLMDVAALMKAEEDALQ